MKNLTEKSVVVSGVGLVTPLGCDRESTWEHIVDGKTGIRKERGLSARVPSWNENGHSSRAVGFAVRAAREALQSADLSNEGVKNFSIGCAVSLSKPVLSNYGISSTPGGNDVDWNVLWRSALEDSVPAVLKRTFGLSGPSANPVAACATGIASIQAGGHWVHQEMCRMALVGAAESSFHPLYETGFQNMGVLASGDSPSCAKPFDKERTGFVMGEGAAVLLIESWGSAQQRGHAPLAVLDSAWLMNGAQDPIRFDEGGASVARLIRRTLPNGMTPDYINAHGTGTQLNDRMEARGIRLAFGGNYQRIPVSSTKAATGHLLGAAGALEAALTVLALRDQIIPPTLNLTQPDPACALCHVAERSQKREMNQALSLSFGFGGQMGAVLFSRL